MHSALLLTACLTCLALPAAAQEESVTPETATEEVLPVPSEADNILLRSAPAEEETASSVTADGTTQPPSATQKHKWTRPANPDEKDSDE